jgi:hypothetical protein
MHHEIELRTAAGGWLRRRGRFRLLAGARHEAERVRREGGEPRIVQVADDGTREVVTG